MTPKEPAAFHERLGQLVVATTDVEGGIRSVLEKGVPKLDAQRVGSLIVAEHPNMLLKQIVKSDLDVDQLDYLLRDAKTTGSTYGQYDIDYLVECLEVAVVDDHPMLCVHMRGLHVVEHYVMARYFYYLCILSQKTRCIIEGILESVVLELIKKGHLPTWGELRAMVRGADFCAFDDTYVLHTMRDAWTKAAVDPVMQHAIRILLQRQLPKVVEEQHRLVPAGDKDPFAADPLPAAGGNEVLSAAARSARVARIPILRFARDKRIEDNERLRDVLLDDPRPIRIFVEQPFVVPEGTPAIPARTSTGKEGLVTLLESLADCSIVAALAGCTTHVRRLYMP